MQTNIACTKGCKKVCYMTSFTQEREKYKSRYLAGLYKLMIQLITAKCRKNVQMLPRKQPLLLSDYFSWHWMDTKGQLALRTHFSGRYLLVISCW